jgi:5-formyltetrahydrofolate cyclo-ligase
MPDRDRMTSDKQEVRERVWAALESAGASVGSVHGRIPDFVGSDQAAQRLADLPEWQAAQTVKANPDQAQLPVRQRGLSERKVVYMAVPKLARPQPFFRLDPVELEQAGLSFEAAAAHRQAAGSVPTVGTADMPPIDLIVCGTVAVDHRGVRIGKGAGYSDIEVALLAEAGLISERTTIVTTVHDLQVVDDELPHAEHDFTVDYIVTPTQVISCSNPYRPGGLVWESLSEAQIEAIPVLGAMRDVGRRET